MQQLYRTSCSKRGRSVETICVDVRIAVSSKSWREGEMGRGTISGSNTFFALSISAASLVLLKESPELDVLALLGSWGVNERTMGPGRGDNIGFGYSNGAGFGATAKSAVCDDRCGEPCRGAPSLELRTIRNG